MALEWLSLDVLFHVYNEENVLQQNDSIYMFINKFPIMLHELHKLILCTKISLLL